jgi:hypothetical protein
MDHARTSTLRERFSTKPLQCFVRSTLRRGHQILNCHHRSVIFVLAALVVFPPRSLAQDRPVDRPGRAIAESTDEPQQAEGDDGGHKRILGIIPNYRTSPPLTNYVPLTTRDKFKMASQDAVDPGTFALAGLFAVEAQLTDETPSFGHGAPAFARYFGAATADFVIGDFMTEAVYPSLLRQDPRYFRKGSGSAWGRLGYAVRQIVWTHADSGHMQFNMSEVAGNATAVAIGNAYYPDNRTLSNNVSKLGIQLAVDTVSNILKEFSPDLDRLFSRSHAVKPRS